MTNIPPQSKIYFLGIGGISMFGLALIAQGLGHKVAGSDAFVSERSEELRKRGFSVVYEQDGKDLESFSPDFVVYTAAVHPSNLDYQKAQELHIPLLSRGEFLGWLSEQYEKSFNISGTHGKSTTTSMLASIFLEAEKKPTIHLGATLKKLNDLPVHLSQERKYFINEACEYANTFQYLHSSMAAILNIDMDHIDYFGNEEKLVQCFVHFSLNLEAKGALLFPYEDKYKDAFLKERSKHSSNHDLLFFALAKNKNEKEILEKKVDFLAYDIEMIGKGSSFRIAYQGKDLGSFSLQVPGFHNISNALVAFAMAFLEGIDINLIQKSLAQFESAEGRFTYKGTFQGAQVYVDYAHHPASTKVTIEAAKLQKPEHLWIVYQPLTYDRVARMFDDYIEALKENELVLFYEIFSDREKDTQGMSSKLLADKLCALGYESVFCENKEEIFEILAQKASEKDIILFLGPEEVRNFAYDLLKTK